ncbi:hypothetical protein HPB50_021054 [Hyalomma asiaticum]|uniref:Uncharacterized protein n=1 Tax=Hyalomma asiaticum TaxID=266040 RepID=A0ACB7SHQ8_HYAAI|nr:hypothetical protein HPB50_021054 [Hyalomma asiaticum]
MSEKKDEDASAWSGHRRPLDVMASLSGKKRAKAARALKPPPQACDSPTEDPWLTLRRAFDKILENQSVDQGFDELYRGAYTMVARNEGQRLYYGLRQAVTEHLANKVRILVLAGVEDDFLQALHQAWSDHQRSMGIISQILMYMERVYVPENNVDGVHKMGVLLFRDEVARCAAVRDRLRETMLGLVKTEREGKRVDRRSLKKACGMLVALGIDSRKVYEEDFEKAFLDESAKFYALRGQEYIKTNGASEYLAQVEQHIREELERAKQCLDESTAVRVAEVVIIELVGKRMEAIADMDNSGVEHMLRNGMMDDLARVYRLLKCVEGGVQRLLESVSKQLRNLGASIVNEMGDSTSLIPKLMELRDYFDHVVQHSFNDDQLAKRTISTDFAYILSLTPKSPKHLSAFLDDLLQTGIKNMTKEASDQLLDRVVAMLRSLQEKDLFERYYKQRLAKRLLLNKSASDEAEKTTGRQAREGVWSSVHLQDGSHVQRRAHLEEYDARIQNGNFPLQNEHGRSRGERACVDDRFLASAYLYAANYPSHHPVAFFPNISIVLSGEA